MKGQRTRTAVCILLGVLLVLVACAPAAQPAAPAPAAPAAPSAPAQPKQPAPAAAPVAPAPVATATASAPAPAAPKPGVIKYGSTLVFSEASHAGGTDPFYNSTQGLKYLGLGYLQLIRAERGDTYYGGYKYVADLAESWEFTTDTEIVFKLKKGVKWAPVEPLKGREVTADDVVYSYKRFLDPQSVVRGALQGLKDVVALDRYTVKLIGEQKSFTLIERARQHPAWIIPKEMVEKYGDLKNIMVGAGPFYEVQRPTGGIAFFVKNPNYYDKDKVAADKIQFAALQDPSTTLAAFRAGNIIAITFTERSDLEALRKTNPDVQVDEAYLGGHERFGLQANLPDMPWADYRVRKALSKAIDRQGIMDALHGGIGPWANGQIPPGLTPWGLPPEEAAKLDFMIFDPKAAKKLMAEAGFPNGFKTKMCWPTVGSAPPPKVILVAQMWKENINVDVDLKATNYNQSGWLGTCFAGKSTDAINWMTSGNVPNWWDYLDFTVRTGGKWNSAQINSKELDSMIDDIMATLDENEQVKKAHALQLLLLTSEKYGHWITVPRGTNVVGAQPWARNWRPHNANDTWKAFMWIDK